MGVFFQKGRGIMCAFFQKERGIPTLAPSFCPAPCDIPLGLFLLAFFVTSSLRYSAGNYPSHSIPLKQAGSLVPCALWCATQAQQRP